MAVTIADFRATIAALLMDTGAAIWPSAYLDAAISAALSEYSKANPGTWEKVLTLPGDGREIAIDSLGDVTDVIDVWWPYDSAATAETWPPNRVRGFRVWWDDGRPVLFLEILDGSQPQQNDELRVFYSGEQQISGLYGATITTVPGRDINVIVTGACAHAALSRSLDLAEVAGTDLYAVAVLGVWGRQKLREFYSLLEEIRAKSARRSVPWGKGWTMDKWD